MVNEWTKFWEESLKFAEAGINNAWRVQEANIKASTSFAALMGNAYARFWGGTAEPALESSDKRFSHEAWNENLAFDVLKQTYLITSQWLSEIADNWQEVDPVVHHRVKFWTGQYTDALSPTNYPFTNPEIIQETMRSGGKNLIQGMQNLLEDMRKGTISQVPANSFEVGKDLACTPGKVVYKNKLIELIQYTPVTEKVYDIPVLTIAPWVNKYYVMDMSPHNSMIRYLVESGFTLFTISWKNPDSTLKGLKWEDYMELGVLDSLGVIRSITGTNRVNMAGYCLGGMMLQTTLAYMAAVGDKTANTATFFATHQDAGNVGDIAAFISEPEVRFLSLLMELSGGYLDGRNMAATFNMLRANDLLWSYVINNYLLGKQPPEFDLLYWNSDSTRVPKTTHMFLLKNFFLEDNFGKPGYLKLKNKPIDLKQIKTPTYTVATQADHIVPWRGAFAMRDRVSSPVRLVLGESGHIAGIINHPDQKSRGYWINDKVEKQKNGSKFDLDAWFEGATHYEGSWWMDWVAWLAKKSGKQIEPPPIGSEKFPPLMDAPGEYILEK